MSSTDRSSSAHRPFFGATIVDRRPNAETPAGRSGRPLAALVLAVLLVGSVPPARADEAPPRPASLFGTVSAEGHGVGAGVSVEAVVDGVVFAQTTTFEVQGTTVYRLDVPADRATTPGVVEGGVDGDTVALRVAGVEVGATIPWQHSVYRRLDLEAVVGPDLGVELDDGVETTNRGDVLSYTLSIRNDSGVDASGVVARFEPPPFVSVTSVDSGGTLETGGQVTWPAFDLAGGATTTRNVVVEVAPAAPLDVTRLIARASVRGDGGAGIDPDPSDDQASDIDTLAAPAGELPDLAVGRDSLEVFPTRPAAGDDSAIFVTVRNLGPGDAGQVPVRVSADDGTVLFEHLFATIPAQGNRQTRFSWLASEGVHNLVVEVDPELTLLEVSRDDNYAEREVAVPRSSGADLTVTVSDRAGLVQSQASLALAGGVEVTVSNGGDLGANGPIALRIFEDRDGDGSQGAGEATLGSTSIPSLAAGASLEVSIPVSGSTAFYHPLAWVRVDADDTVAEQREDNNAASLFGDCEILPAPAPALEPELEWHVDDLEVEVTPMVAQLSDDDGDGRIDSRDTPDVVFLSFDGQSRLVVALSGLDGRRLWSFRDSVDHPLPFEAAQIAVGDLDGDGISEIVVPLRNGRLLCLDASGVARWVSDPVPGVGERFVGSISLGDLSGDGVPEIAVGRVVLDNRGQQIAVGTANAGQNWNFYGPFGSVLPPGVTNHAHSVIADVDLDGQAELVAGDTLYRLVDGELTIVWDHVEPDNLMRDGPSAVGNLDADPEAEIVYVSSGQILVLNHDGSIRSPRRTLVPFIPFQMPTFWGGPPTLADLDGDGLDEILVAAATHLLAFNGGLGTRWRVPIGPDFGAFHGVSAFDFDGDGTREVLYRDETRALMLDGATGAEIFALEASSKTGSEYPVAADVDGDGRVEWLIPANTAFDGDASTRGLHVYGHPGWVGSRGLWNQYGYHQTHILDDGTLVSPWRPNWDTSGSGALAGGVDGSFRVNRQLPPPRAYRPNVTVSVARVGVPGIDGIPITLRIGNGGAGHLGPGTVLRLYAGDPSGGDIALEVTLDGGLRPGAWRDETLFWRRSTAGNQPVSAVLDPDVLLDDCDRFDNRLDFLLEPALLGDLALVSLVAPDPASVGSNVPVTARVANNGLAISSPNTLRLSLGAAADGEVLDTVEVGEIDPGDTLDLELLWDSRGADLGPVLLRALVDADDVVVESDEGNNSRLVGVTLVAPTGPDLALDFLRAEPTQAGEGQVAQLIATVTSRGSDFVGASEVAFAVNNAEVGRAPVASLLAGASIEVAIAYDTLGHPGSLALTATVDPGNLISEIDEGNNVATAELTVEPSPLQLTVSTDRFAYGAGEDVAVAVVATNSEAQASYRLTIRVLDAVGSEVTTLEDTVLDLSTGSTPIDRLWNTDTTTAGPHTVVAELQDTVSVRRAIAVTSFSIAPDLSALATVFANRDVYPPNDQAELMGAVTNTSANTELADLISILAVVDPAGDEVFRVETPLAVLGIGDSATVDGVWDVGTAPPGGYAVQHSTRTQAGALVAFAEVPITVEDSAVTGAGLLGEIEATPTILGAGAPLLTAYAVRNEGNNAMPDLELSLELVRVSDGVAVSSQRIAQPLDLGSMADDAVAFVTDDLVAGDYLASLLGELPGVRICLDRSPFTAVPGLSVGDVVLAEGDGGTSQAIFTVRLSEPLASDITVDAATVDATARSGVDYQAVTGNLTLLAGETETTVSVSVFGDLEEEPDELFLVELSNPLGVELGDAQGLGTIEDEEGCASTNLLRNGDAEEGVPGDPVPGWSATGTWRQRFADPPPLSNRAAFEVIDGGSLEQTIDVSAFGAVIDGGGQEILVSSFLHRIDPAGTDTGSLELDYLAADGVTVLDTFDSAIAAPPLASGGWQSVVDRRPAPPGTRALRLRLSTADVDLDGRHGVVFDRLELLALGTPTVVLGDAEVLEGDGGSVLASLTVALACEQPGDVAIDWGTVADSATGSDFQATGGTVVIPAGTTTAVIDVTVLGDSLDEPDETFFVDLAPNAGLAAIDPRGVVTIVDDDGPVAISVDDPNASEGDAPGAEVAIFTVTLSTLSGKPVSVDYQAVAGSALAGEDFQSVTGTAVVPVGDLSTTISVPLVGDRRNEPTESFDLVLGSAQNAVVADGSGTATVFDDDTVLFSVSDVEVVEGDAAGSEAVFTVSLSVPSTATVSVDQTTQDGDAVAGDDYVATSGNLSFAPGTTEQTVTVALVADLIREPLETFTLVLSNPVGGSLGDPEGIATVIDDDGILISVADAVVQEGTGSLSVLVPVTLSKAATAEVTVAYQTLDDSARDGEDYSGANDTLVFPVGTTRVDVEIPILDDDADEAFESFLLVLSDPVEGLLLDPEAVVSIVDDDTWFVNGNASATAIPGCLQLTPASGGNGSVWNTDKIDLTTSFDMTWKVHLGANDSGADGIVFALQNHGATIRGGGGVGMGYSGIRPSIGVEMDTWRNSFDPVYDHIGVNQDGGLTHILHPAVGMADDLPNVEDGQEHDLRLIWNVDHDTLDVHFDGDERAYTLLDDPVNGIFLGVSEAYYGFTAATGGARNLHYVCPTLECHGTTDTPAISVGDVRLRETQDGTQSFFFPVTLHCPSDQVVTVDFATADGSGDLVAAQAGSDYQATAGTLTFLPGETAAVVEVVVFGDIDEEEDEGFRVLLANPTGGAVVRYAEGHGTILSDDIQATIDPTETFLLEQDGRPRTWWLDIELTGSLSAPVTLDYTLVDGSAIDGLDYVDTSGTLTVPSGASSFQIPIQIRGDDLPEGPETFHLDYTADAVIATGRITLTLIDDDDCTSPNLLLNGGAEGAVVSGAPEFWTEIESLNWQRRNGGPAPWDGSFYFGAGSGFAPAELRQDVDLSSWAGLIDGDQLDLAIHSMVTTSVGDDAAKVILELLDSGGALLEQWDSGLHFNTGWNALGSLVHAPVGTRTARVRLIGERFSGSFTDAFFDQVELRALRVPSLLIADVALDEGAAGVGTAEVPVSLTCGSSPLPISVDYLTSDGTAAAGSDYQASVGTVTLAPGETTATIAVPILGDTIPEDDETFFVNLASPRNAGIFDGQGVVTLLNDEVLVSISDAQVVEMSRDIVEMAFTVTLDRVSDLIIALEWATADAPPGPGSATAGIDYEADLSTLTFYPGVTEKTIQVRVVGDTQVENDEIFFVNLLSVENAEIADGQGIGTIIQDDIALTIADATVTEGGLGDGRQAVFTLELNAPSLVEVLVDYTTLEGTATEGVDYQAASGTVLFAPGEERKTVAIDIVGDSDPETGETFFLLLDNAIHADLRRAEANGFIVDDDDCPGPNLLLNPGGEELLSDNNVSHWQEITGTRWTRSTVSPLEGSFVIASIDRPLAELRQDVPVGVYAEFIDAGIQRFLFEGFVRPAATTLPDQGQIVLEYLDIDRVELDRYTSDLVSDTTSWQGVSDLRTVPVGTRWIRVRLLAHWQGNSGNNDVYFDRLAVRSVGTPIVVVDDVEIDEGDEENVEITFEVGLNCPADTPVALTYTTVDDTAEAGEDYQPTSGTLEFAVGETSKPVTVTTFGDFKREVAETFLLELAMLDGAVLIQPQAQAVLIDADPGAAPVAPVPGDDWVYTTDDDFDLGVQVSVQHDDPQDDQLQLTEETSTFPFLWIAASSRNTIVKIDTRSGAILGEYRTNPERVGSSNPSRTTVTLDGSVWVGNRNNQSIAHIGLPELNQCIDRNGNGVIDTSTGYGDIRRWPNPGHEDSQGGVSTAEDECILHFVKTTSSGTRHLSVTPDNNLWVSGTGHRIFDLIDTETGETIRTTQSFPCGGYGGLTDPNGVVWSSTQRGRVLRFDPSDDSFECVDMGLDVYGLSIDREGTIWASSVANNRVWRISPDASLVEGPFWHASNPAQGLAVTDDGDVWVSASLIGDRRFVSHLKNDGTFVGIVLDVPSGGTGVVVDAAGKIWVAAQRASQVARIDPRKGPIGADGVTRIGEVDLVVDLPGSGPYNYSDMTGFVSQVATSKRGTWTTIQDSGVEGTGWGTISWNGEPEGFVPDGGTIRVEVRASDAVPDLGAESWIEIDSGVPFDVVGRYLQVRVTLLPDGEGTSPVLSDLVIGQLPEGELSVGDATVLEGDPVAGGGSSGGTTEAVFTLSLAAPTSREVTADYAVVAGTAEAGVDYLEQPGGGHIGTVFFEAGETEKTITVEVVRDLYAELDETFTVEIVDTFNTVVVDGVGEGLIQNDDIPDLAVVKSDQLLDLDADGEVNPGDTVRYVTTLVAGGTGATTGVVWRDTVPSHTALVPGSLTTDVGAVVDATGPELVVDLVHLLPGETATVSFEVTVVDPFPSDVDTIANQALVDTVELGQIPSDDPDTAPVGDPTSTPVTDMPGATTQCTVDGFDDPTLADWTFTFLGDADQGGASAEAGRLLLSGDGTSLYHSGDDGAFLYQTLEGDFRVEVDVLGFPIDEGGAVRKTALMLRSGLGDRDPRVMVTYVPHMPGATPDDPTTTAAQFDVRVLSGDGGEELANTVFELPLPTRLAIERRGEQVRALYSVDGGASWIQPNGAGHHGEIAVDLGTQVLAGMAVASYDADTVFGAELDAFAVCRPDEQPPIDPPPPPVCDPDEDLDVLFLLDLSGSMGAQYPGALTKLDAAQQAIQALSDHLLARGDSSRAALATYAGFRTPEENLAGAFTLHSGFDADIASVAGLALAFDAASLDPGTPTPAALAFDGVIELMSAAADPNRQPVVVWLTDGIPNIDLEGRGPDGYELEELQDISLYGSDGTFLSWGRVGWSGGFNPALGTFDGEPLANTMFQLEALDAAVPETLVYGVALQGDGIGLGTFNEDLLEYAAHVSGARSFSATDTAGLLAAIGNLGRDLDCGGLGTASLGDRVWEDLDGDGLEGLSEPGIPGVVVDLFDDSGFGVTTTTTDATGSYLFDELPAGTYTVVVDPSTLPVGLDVPTFDLDGVVTVDRVEVTVVDGEARLAVDFGYQRRDLGPPTTVCEDDGFDGAGLDPVWTSTHLGDSDQGTAVPIGGRLHLSGDGSSLYHDADNAHFLHREASGDAFRAEVTITDFPVDVGGGPRKACLTARSGLGPWDPRVMICFLPQFTTGSGDTTAIQFDFRPEALAPGEELATTVLHVPLPVRFALEQRDGVWTAYYSRDDGATWIRPIGGEGGSVALDLGVTPRVGLAVASYDTANTLTAELDDFALCGPNPVPPVDPPDRFCDVGTPLDVVLLLDASSSMASPIPDGLGGSISRYAAARDALRSLTTTLAARGDGSRAALMSFHGHDTVTENLVDHATLHQALTSDLGAVDFALSQLDPSTIGPVIESPTALALDTTLGLLQSDGDPARAPVVVLVSDGIPNIDRRGRGPAGYELESIQAISLYDPAGAFRSWGEVAWDGGFNPLLGTFDGEPLANTMAVLEEMVEALPTLRVYGVGVEGSGEGFGTFNDDLLQFAAHATGGRAFIAADAPGLLAASDSVAADLACALGGTASLGDRVWQDGDADGIQDLEEAGLSGVVLDLLDGAGVGVGRATSGIDGVYGFDDLAAGDYTVRLDPTSLPAGVREPSSDLDGTETAHRATVSVAVGESRDDVDFGVREPDLGPETALCTPEPFEAPVLDPTWVNAFLGDADLGGASIVDGQLELSGNGTSLFHGDDNGYFLFQQQDEDFRIEVDVTGYPVDAGGPVRKACLIVREGTQPRDARVMACHIPHLPDPPTTALQFDVRFEDGRTEDLANLLTDIPLPVRLAIDRRGDVFSVYYSLDAGTTWIRPTGGLGGSTTVDMGGSALAGVAVASYDDATVFTASFDDYRVCTPNPTAAFVPPPLVACEAERPVDAVLVLDRSGSLRNGFDGSSSRLAAAQAALGQFTDQLALRGDGSRVALLSFSGLATPDDNLASSVTVHHGLTSDFATVGSTLAGFEATALDPGAGAPAALALRRALQVLQSEGNTDHRPVVIWLLDGHPNIDGAGHGPVEYQADELEAIRLLDGQGGFLSWGQVAWAGDFNGTLGTYDGEVFANTMVELEGLRTGFDAIQIYGLALQGDGVIADPFHEDLLTYAAYVSGSLPFTGSTTDQLLAAIQGVLDDLACVE